jgi:hypothetical protein
MILFIPRMLITIWISISSQAEHAQKFVTNGAEHAQK